MDEHEQQQGGTGGGEPLSLGAFLRRQRELAELTLNQFAGTVGISNAYLSQIERGLRQPSRQVLQAIASGLHLSADAIDGYARPAAPAASEVLAAIERDPALTTRQRALLADTYRSLVELNETRGRHGDRSSETMEDA